MISSLPMDLANCFILKTYNEGYKSPAHIAECCFPL